MNPSRPIQAPQDLNILINADGTLNPAEAVVTSGGEVTWTNNAVKTASLIFSTSPFYDGTTTLTVAAGATTPNNQTGAFAIYRCFLNP
jgi:plastocyanin